MQPNPVEIVPQAHSGRRAATRTELEKFEDTNKRDQRSQTVSAHNVPKERRVMASAAAQAAFRVKEGWLGGGCL